MISFFRTLLTFIVVGISTIVVGLSVIVAGLVGVEDKPGGIFDITPQRLTTAGL